MKSAGKNLKEGGVAMQDCEVMEVANFKKVMLESRVEK
jgi:hypothetical protein